MFQADQADDSPAGCLAADFFGEGIGLGWKGGIGEIGKRVDCFSNALLDGRDEALVEHADAARERAAHQRVALGQEA